MKFSHDWMADTHPDALRVYLKANHDLSAQRTFDAVVEMYETMALTCQQQERRRRPADSERQIFLRAAARRLGNALVKRVYPDFIGD